MVQIGITSSSDEKYCIPPLKESLSSTTSRQKYKKQFTLSIPKFRRSKSSERISQTKEPNLEDSVLDRMRYEEFSRLDDTGTVYLDYAGAALYPKHLLTMHHKFLEQHVLGNPHSGSPA
jgi:hypothetical protein